MTDKQFIKNVFLPNIILPDSIKTLGESLPSSLSTVVLHVLSDVGMIIQNNDSEINVHKDVSEDFLKIIYKNNELYNAIDKITDESFRNKIYIYSDYYPSFGLIIKVLSY